MKLESKYIEFQSLKKEFENADSKMVAILSRPQRTWTLIYSLQ